MSDPQLGLFRDQSGQGTTEVQRAFEIIWNRLVDMRVMSRSKRTRRSILTKRHSEHGL